MKGKNENNLNQPLFLMLKIKTNASNMKGKNENNLNQSLFLMLKIYCAKFTNLYKHRTKLKLKIKIKETKLSSK